MKHTRSDAYRNRPRTHLTWEDHRLTRTDPRRVSATTYPVVPFDLPKGERFTRGRSLGKRQFYTDLAGREHPATKAGPGKGIKYVFARVIRTAKAKWRATVASKIHAAQDTAGE